MLERAKIEKLIQEDFEAFDFANQPMTEYCEYNKNKHIQMATQIVMNAFSWKQCYSLTEVDDMIHGLNHLFFNGVAAGQFFERNREKENDEN